LPFYTLGQRAGLKIGGRADCPQSPWFVAAKDSDRNALIVVQGSGHPALSRAELHVGELRWLASEPTGIADGLDLDARIRHRHTPAPCRVRRLDDGRVHVKFREPQKSPTPGQYAVFYRGDECLGGGVILDSELKLTGAPAVHVATA
jgi:tRNA-specific 2-thiouridylase